MYRHVCVVCVYTSQCVNYSILLSFHHLFQLVRLVANLSIHPEVGPAVARDEDIVDYLLRIIGEAGEALTSLGGRRRGRERGGGE